MERPPESPPVESPAAARRGRRYAVVAAIVGVLALTAAGCGALGYTSGNADRQNGKKLFVNGSGGKPGCGACHALVDAGTTGAIGPNLDDAFQQALKTGMTESTIRQVVRGQIAYPDSSPSTGSPGMPKDLVTGDDARDVAAYVASAVVKDTASGTTRAVASPAPTPTPTPTPAPAPKPSGGGSKPAGSPADLAAGKTVFLGAGGCGACHTLKDAGSSGTVGPKLDGVVADAKTAGQPLEAYVQQSIEDPNAYVVPGFPKGVMPPDFKSTLSAKQIADLVAYIVSAAGSS